MLRRMHVVIVARSMLCIWHFAMAQPRNAIR